MTFANRTDAGRQLGAALAEYANDPGVLVLALPRGGVPVAHEVASILSAPLDVFIVRKLGVPGHDELAMGAIAAGGIEVLNRDLIHELGIPGAVVQWVARRERLELDRRERLYRGGRQPPPVRSRTVILVDDGLATGSTMEAAVLAVKQGAPAAVIVAAPVGAREACERLERVTDRVVCLSMPEPFRAVGLWYRDFREISDEEVTALTTAASLASSSD